ncbi:MAG TPA: hypothetical protein VMZ02_03945 [Candidatus Limnocylindrales bacterium]|nr:hypothetical protein [Candidatus Limnocylindrales bacterium]
MPLRLTAQMKQRITRRTLAMVQRSLGYFPELKDAAITIGYTRKHLGSATVIYRKHELYRLIVRLRVRKVTYHTIGHELTHLVQGLGYGDRFGARRADPERIPTGEIQCDIWTLARDPLFLDDPPTYIKMPRSMREHWPDFAESVRALCIAAIDKRHTQRQYIQWLEKEIRQLAKAPRCEQSTGSAQLFLPFVI